MQVSQFKISDYDNPVATAVKKIGGIKRAAKKLGHDEVVIRLWIRKGFVPYRRCAEILNDYTDVPEDDLLRQSE